MYWIVYALFSLAETFADSLVSWYVTISIEYEYERATIVTRFPFYYEIKLLFVFWLVLPITKVSDDPQHYHIVELTL